MNKKIDSPTGRPSDSRTERHAWNMLYRKPSDVSSKGISGKLNKKEMLDGLTENYNFEGKKVLDVGTGNAEYMLSLALGHAVKKIVAIDFSEEAVKSAEEKRKKLDLTNCAFITSDATCLPFKDNSFDVVTMVSVLHHLPYPQKTLQEVFRVAETFIMFERNKLNPYEWICLLRRKKDYPSDPSFFLWEIKHLIRNSGFEIEELKYSQLVPYAIYNFRVLKKIPCRDSIIKGILHVSRLLQQVPWVRCFSRVVMIKVKKLKKNLIADPVVISRQMHKFYTRIFC